MRFINHKSAAAIFLYFLLVVVTVFLRIYFEKWFFKPLNREEKVERVIIIEQGDSLVEVSRNLKNQGIIYFTTPFKLYFKVKKLDGKIKPGTYILNNFMGFQELAAFLIKGNNIEIWVTVPEGYTLDEIDKQLLNSGLLIRRGEFLDYTETYLKNRNYKLNIDGFEMEIKSLEGFMFPDTYRFRKNDNLEVVINKFLSNFARRLVENELSSKIKQSKLDFYSIVKIASILEKEVKTFNEKRLAADLILRRLESNKLLQVDATLNYILEQKKPALSANDLKNDSPYNSYKYKGLPPTPISNPGIESLLAVLDPKPNDYWFYVSDLKTGKTYFSKNFEEHKEIKFKLLNL